MKVAVVSDIHGNIWALEAVIADIARRQVDLVINAGDILSGPLEPAATAERLMALKWPTIRGNHERQLLACAEAPGGLSDQFAFEHTTAAQQDWLRALPIDLSLSEPGIYVCHGAPGDDLTYFLEEVGLGGAHAACDESVELRAAGIRAGLILCGHSHKPRVRALCDGRLIVNPGSVGLQAYDDDHPHHHVIENGSPHARYAICEWRDGQWQVDLCAVAYDHRSAAAAARAHGSDSWGRWLETGRARH
ncbi:metallophosphoesterase family protein [Paludibacterium purpuratum]|uniref:Putative phosphoesterase n=1 Tax=Paludibacterium purpuratum TaxID=1144873 RepID=A0A4R7BD00_9NEIS|nr:metallophosphoesterase family protein [Paludibacterium purpuratum]TDR82960.1 putative phosphoesterase [Paludibacterium purpuratum]